jgi:hypothetical protein
MRAIHSTDRVPVSAVRPALDLGTTNIPDQRRFAGSVVAHGETFFERVVSGK